MIQHSFDSVRLCLHDRMPLLLAANPGYEGRRRTYNLDLDSERPGMTAERAHQEVRFQRAIVISRAPNQVPNHAHERRISKFLPEPDLVLVELIHVMIRGRPQH